MSKKRSPPQSSSSTPYAKKLKEKHNTTAARGGHNWVLAKQASIDWVNKIKSTFQDEDDDRTYHSFIDIMTRYGQKHNNIDQVYQELKTLFKTEPGLCIEFTKFLADFDEKEKTHDEEQSSVMDSIGKKTSFRKKGHNPYEQMLFECEDRQFELDLYSKRLESAMEHAMCLVNDYKNTDICENPIGVVEKYFTLHDMRCFEKLYDEHGLEMIDLLWCNPVVVVKICILPRLKQQLEKLIGFSSRANKVWGELYAKYYPKAVDHQSFYVEKQVPRNPSSGSFKILNKLRTGANEDIGEKEEPSVIAADQPTVQNVDSGNSAAEEEQSTVQYPESMNSNSVSQEKSCQVSMGMSLQNGEQLD